MREESGRPFFQEVRSAIAKSVYASGRISDRVRCKYRLQQRRFWSRWVTKAHGRHMGDLGWIPGPVHTSFTEVIIVRHGETTWNKSGRLQGQYDSDLNELGFQQAEAVARRLAQGDLPLTTVYTSDLKRARLTGEAIAAAGGVAQAVITRADLRERHLGVLQGLTVKEARQSEPEALRALESKRKDVSIAGGGESRAQLQQRAAAAVEDLARAHRGERVVVVCHGGVIHALHEHATGYPCKGEVANCSFSVVSVSTTGKWDVLHWGDVGHLAHLSFLKGHTL
ncbi:phosphoglycerate mutase [Klebsormidium nitens]|uniref:Phosphoglycerate mutase n=1 Tax=Klebsormidium nitens TaxID=105231 RepID=A0A1Y1I0D3_KLENI|nr:phosphoglycerate mutase [Klebsormidium nitens]|eukprot:GAQ82621.1 phosphoglycerate mutase [Klebsormidium nitens]